MNSIDPQFDDNLRSALLSRIGSEQHRPARRTRLMAIGIAVAGTLLIGGAGAATASILLRPGATEVVTVGDRISETHSGTATVELGSRPADTTNIKIKLVCATAGSFTFPDGAGGVCSEGNVTGYTIPAPEGTHSVTITAASSLTWSITVQYTHETVTPFAVNESGKTYGIESAQNGTPDLVAVFTVDGKSGYAYQADIAAVDGSSVENPSEAVAWTKAHKGTYSDVPVYDLDGVTKIGVYRIGDWDGVPYSD